MFHAPIAMADGPSCMWGADGNMVCHDGKKPRFRGEMQSDTYMDLVGPGGNCAPNGATCAAGLTCYDSGTGESCMQMAQEGESCGAKSTMCVSGPAACVSGVCMNPANIYGN